MVTSGQKKSCNAYTPIAVFAGLALAAGLFWHRPAYAAQPTVVEFSGADNVALKGVLYAPPGPGPFPAIIAMHGCSGLMDQEGGLSARHKDWGERLLAQGFVVLFPDSYASRGLGPQCRNPDRKIRPSRERVADAKAALSYLASLSQVKADAISLLGWSNGGSSVLYAVKPENAPQSGPDFSRAVAFYPGCLKPLQSGGWRTRAPLLVLIGEADDWTPAAPCVSLMDSARQAGEPATIVTYNGAYHDFDHPSLPVHMVRHLAFTGSGRGYAHSGTDPEARADAIARASAYFAR